jgi:hypothetical protein
MSTTISPTAREYLWYLKNNERKHLVPLWENLSDIKNAPRYAFYKFNDILSGLDLRTYFERAHEAVLVLLDTIFPVASVDDGNTEFVIVVCAEAWTSLNHSLQRISRELSSETHDFGGSVSYIVSLVEYYARILGFKAVAIEEYRVQGIADYGTTDFFGTIGHFLKDFIEISEGKCADLPFVTAYRNVRPFKVKMSEPIILKSQPFNSLSSSLISKNA